ncbi:signal peptidase [Sphingobacterium sp. E70]|uniref:signal peptidase n=1 Tax=Sphingobacterium sp. E70 TaxID=2853439 RepID=UPI00211CC79A|nr:signal peptidase [Sphingobacterium sp. E70]ULT28414.1 signal peptidase [Sphingobacterium sp. E70]
MNKYLRKGLREIIIGVLLVILGYYLMEQRSNWYKLAMLVGVITFSIGFLTLIYRMIRKVDRNAIIEMRGEAHKEDIHKKIRKKMLNKTRVSS